MSKYFLLSLFTLSIFSVQANLLKDGSFSNIQASFQTNLNLKASCASGPATYCISERGWGSDDLSSPSDYLLKVDGFLSSSISNIIWSETIVTSAAGDYEFEFWTRLRSSQHHIKLEFRVNGLLLGFYESDGDAAWKKGLFKFHFDGSSSNLKIELIQNKFGHFTDFDLDEMSLKTNSSSSGNGTSNGNGSSGVSSPPYENPDSNSGISISFYPNPVVDYATVKVDSGYGNYSLLIFSLDGKLIRDWNNLEPGEFEIYLGYLPRSHYIFRVYQNKEILKSGRFLVF